MDYHEVVDELESAEQELGLAACDVDETEGAGLDLTGLDLGTGAAASGGGTTDAEPVRRGISLARSAP